jgi:hypothetical protein
MKLVKICVFLLIFLVACSDHQSTENLNINVVVRVGKNVLTKNDLSDICKIASESGDSVAFVQNYIDKWIENELFYIEAEKKIKENSDIKKLLDNYRKTLIINEFKQYIANEETPQPSDEELMIFYETQKQNHNYLVQTPFIKGALLMVPKKSPQIAMLKSAMKKLDDKSIEQIEKYSLKTPVTYNFFIDKWLNLKDVQTVLPSYATQADNLLMPNQLYEFKDSINYYYLSVTAYLPVGSNMPFEMVKDEIISIVKEKQKLATLKNYTEEMLKKANKKGIVVINN